jgi:hypothetical protein
MVVPMTESESEQITVRLRPEGPFVVKCAMYRCLAYHDTEGKWRSYWKQDLLPEPVEIVRVEREH